MAMMALLSLTVHRPVIMMYLCYVVVIREGGRVVVFERERANGRATVTFELSCSFFWFPPISCSGQDRWSQVSTS